MHKPVGYRGSVSETARSYKLGGHDDEILFSKLISGSITTGSHTGKTDVIGPDNKTYSVKGGNKKWQIFLYSYDRLSTDKDFYKYPDLGRSLIKSLESFPISYELYSNHKSLCLSQISTYMKENGIKTSLKDISIISKIVDYDNYYLQSKLTLQENNIILSKIMKDVEILKYFLHKSIFNLDEVDCLAVKMKGNFYIFDRSDVLNILASSLDISTSRAGNRNTDLNINGQKLIMKYLNNIVELEIRNDSAKHYRQMRLNVIKNSFMSLLLEKTYDHAVNNSKVIHRKIK